MKISELLLMSMFCFAGTTQASAIRVLSITDTPETRDFTYYNALGPYLHILNKYNSPAQLLKDRYVVTQVGWMEAKNVWKDLPSYHAVVLWDTPTKIADSRNTDPWYSDLEVIGDGLAQRLVNFVKDGGALIMAGGVTCYGDAPARLGSSDPRTENKRRYFGYARSPLTEILPVHIPEGITLTGYTGGNIKVANDPLLSGLDFSKWGFATYHKVRAKQGAEILVATESGDPLVSRWTVGKGRVICVTAAPRGNPIVNSNVNPIWSDEPIFWDRCIRWAVRKNLSEHARSQKMDRQNAERRINNIGAQPALALSAEYPYAVHICDPAMPMSLGPLAFRYYRDLGFNHIVMQGQRPSKDFLRAYVDGLAANDMAAFLHPDLCDAAREAGVDPKDYAQITLPSGLFAMRYGNPYPDPFSPAVVQHAVARAEELMPLVVSYPQIRGMFHDDEWAWVMGYRNPYEGGPGVGSYSPAANARYKKLTGQEPPPPIYREPGYVAPESDPWLQWCKLMRQDAYREYNQAVADAVRKYRPDFLLSNYPGGFEGNLDIMIEEVYLDCWVASELSTIERLDVRSNFREDSKRLVFPIWALIGIFRMPEDKSVYPETLRLTAGLSLGSAARGIILWNSANIWAPYMQHPHRGPLEPEVKHLGMHLKRFGPMYLKLSKARPDLWILSSWFWVNSYDSYYFLQPEKSDTVNKEQPWWPHQVLEVTVPAVLRAGYYAECVTEKQILSPRLFEQKAVLVPGLLYCREAVVNRLEEYIQKGGTVLTDLSTKVKIRGAITMHIDLAKWHYDIAAGKRPIAQPAEINYQKHRELREAHVRQAIPALQEALAPVVRPQVALNDSNAAYTVLENGDARYVFIYNSDINRHHSFRIRWPNPRWYVYDVFEGKLLPEHKSSIVQLPPGGWKVYSLVPYVLQRMGLERHGDKIKIKIFTDGGRLFRAAVPVEIRIGSTTFYASTDTGQCELVVPQGEKVEVKELFSGKRASL